MELFQLVLFCVLGAMVAVGFALLAQLSRMLRERHPDKYEQLELAHMWPDSLMGWVRGFDNSGPVKALLGFLWRREYFGLRDDAIARLGGLMRGLFATYVVLFAVLAGSIVMDAMRAGDAREAVRRSPPSLDDRRALAFDLHRRSRWTEALAVYDELLGESGADAELVYWRGVARAGAGRHDEALVDLRRVMDLEPGKLEAYREADRILARQGRVDDRLDAWNRYLRVVPGDAEAHFARARAHFDRRDFASAHADAKRACEIGNADACPVAERLQGRK